MTIQRNQKEFEKKIKKFLPDYSVTSRVVYFLQHPIHLKQLGGTNSMLARYLSESESCKLKFLKHGDKM